MILIGFHLRSGLSLKEKQNKLKHATDLQVVATVAKQCLEATDS